MCGMKPKRRKNACSSCGLRHEPPTGKYCQQADGSPANGAGSGNVAESASAVGELEKRMGHIEAMLERMSASAVSVPAEAGHNAAAAAGSRQRGQEDWRASGSESPVDLQSTMSTTESDDDGEGTPRPRRRRRRRGRYRVKGEKPSTFEELMVETFELMSKMALAGEDVGGVTKHGLVLAKKAATGHYRTETLVGYDAAVRERANTGGPVAFAEVSHEDLVTYFCFDGTKAAQMPTTARRRTGTISRGPVGVCRAFNGVRGCTYRACRYAHKCGECGETGHPRQECTTKRDR